jgi:hypothetical protein
VSSFIGEPTKYFLSLHTVIHKSKWRSHLDKKEGFVIVVQRWMCAATLAFVKCRRALSHPFYGPIETCFAIILKDAE